VTFQYPWRVRACCLAVVLGSYACEPSAPSHEAGEGNVRDSASALWTNGDFETGTAGNAPPSWTVTTFLDPGVTVQSPQTRTGLNLGAGGTALTTIKRAAAGPESRTDPNLGAGASLRWPKFGNQCVLVNEGGKNKNVNDLSQQMTIAAGDVDAADGLVHVRFVAAPVLENPAHAATEQPYYFVQLTNNTSGTILYTDFNLSAQAGVPWKISNGFYYTDWQLVDIAPGAAKLKVGDQVTLDVIGSGCSLGGHFGQIYVDGIGTSIASLFTSGTAPAQANAGTNLTYTIAYKNGSATPAAGVQVDFTLPPNTTFVSLTAPGLVCTTPAVGAAGLVHCTIGALAAGATGNFQLTVLIDATASGTLIAGNYDIYATGVTPLLGSHIKTTIGCTADTDCAAGNWCNEALSTCGPTLANGVAIPTDAPHTAPTLDGTCTAAAGTLVCTSKVCDTADHECGFGNGAGPCAAGNASVVCRSLICDTADSKCGYANGDGACTTADAGVVCRSAVCDPDLKCGFANGSGVCDAGSAGKVCRSGVCDPDTKCGYAVGDGPCTTANAATVCRSGSCSVSGTCAPAGGCVADADCTGGKWCMEATNTCTAKLSNGSALPTDAPHTNPTLNGACTPAAATLVCASSVCDAADNKCGYAAGDGPCTPANGAVVCRSGACSATGNVCLAAGACAVDTDCDATQWCNTSSLMCLPKLPNGQPVPTVAGHMPTLNGACTPGAGSAVCASGVCDPKDNLCGLASADGPCANTAQCRVGKCSSSNVCVECTNDSECSATQYCTTNNACAPKLPSGNPVGNPDGSQGANAAAASLEGGGLACSATPRSRGGMSGGALAFGLLATIALVVRRRRREEAR
jgi:uncharacterized repeat protein (TIGR01451 family)